MQKKSDSELDIVVFGATGHVGHLVAEHFVREYDGKPNAPKWAMAGRNLAKLQSARDEIGAPADTPLITADATNPASLKAMCQRTRIVLTTVGPYQLYGNEPIVACVETGTDYADLCAETAWMAKQIEQHHEAAKASGARICFSSGFGCIPFDLGVLMLQKHATERFGIPAPRVKTRVRALESTSSSGDTAAIVKATMAKAARKPSLLKVLADPFALTPGFTGPEQPGGMIPKYDTDLGSWAIPFITASINTRNIHRTNYLRGHPYGEDFCYDEMVLINPSMIGKQVAEAITDAVKSIGDGGPKSGERPTKTEGKNGCYDILILGNYPNGQSICYSVRGNYDPGYGSTSRMLAETGMALLNSEGEGGVGTPGSFLGKRLVDRLCTHAEISFEIVG